MAETGPNDALDLGVCVRVQAKPRVRGFVIVYSRMGRDFTNLLVGSSRIKTLLFFSSTRPREKSCLCPWESKLAPRSALRTCASLPVLRASHKTDQRPTCTSAETISASLASPYGSRLCLIEAVKMKGSWLRQLTRRRIKSVGIVVMSSPSKIIWPDATSLSRRSDRTSELFPLDSTVVSSRMARFLARGLADVPSGPPTESNLLAWPDGQINARQYRLRVFVVSHRDVPKFYRAL